MTDFTKPMLAPNGAATAYHSMRSIEGRGGDTMTVNVASYGSEADFLLGNPPLWTTPMQMPVASLGPGPNFWRSITTWLMGTPPFDGSVAVPAADPDPIVAARARRWAILKASRSAALMAVDIDASQGVINTATKAIRDKTAQIKAQLDAATTTDQINAVVWTP